MIDVQDASLNAAETELLFLGPRRIMRLNLADPSEILGVVDIVNGPSRAVGLTLAEDGSLRVLGYVGSGASPIYSLEGDLATNDKITVSLEQIQFKI